MIGTEILDIVFRPRRLIGDIHAQVTIEEAHTDELVITEHPVEMGSSISDHAYNKPSDLIIQCGWSNTSLDGAVTLVTGIMDGGGLSYIKKVYNDLLELQKSRVPFDIVTGKRAYKDMLIRSLETTTSAATENAMIIKVRCSQVLLVDTQVVEAPPVENQGTPEKTAQTKQAGEKTLEKVENDGLLSKLKGYISDVFF